MQPNSTNSPSTCQALEAAALGYAELDYGVFPCRPSEKAPLTQRRFQDASADLELIEQWWTWRPTATQRNQQAQRAGGDP